MRLIALTSIGFLLGLFLVLLLPAIIGTWLTDLWMTLTGTPVRCNGGEDADHSPTDDSGARLWAMIDEARRQVWINGIEKDVQNHE